MAAEHVLKEQSFLGLLLVQEGPVLPELNGTEVVFIVIFLSGKFAVVASANQVESGFLLGDEVFGVALVPERVVDGGYFGELDEGFHFSEVGKGVLAGEGGFYVFGRTHRVVLHADGVEVVFLF